MDKDINKNGQCYYLSAVTATWPLHRETLAMSLANLWTMVCGIKKMNNSPGSHELQEVQEL